MSHLNQTVFLSFDGTSQAAGKDDSYNLQNKNSFTIDYLHWTCTIQTEIGTLSEI